MDMDQDDIGGGWILEEPVAESCAIPEPPPEPPVAEQQSITPLVAGGIGIVALIAGFIFGRASGRK